MKANVYGRRFDDFKVGALYKHPWEVTVDGGALAIFQANFMDAVPTYASARFARELGFRDRPIHPLLLLNFGLSFSVHDVSEQAIAHLAYVDVRFPNACYPGETLTAESLVRSVKESSQPDRGVVHVHTLVRGDDGKIVCSFERKALVRRGGAVEGRVPTPYLHEGKEFKSVARLPPELSTDIHLPVRDFGFAGFAEDFAVGDVLVHGSGKTVEAAEHMQLAFLMRNSHPLHFDEVYCREGSSFAGTRVVYGGLVFSWVATLAARDTMGNALWDYGFDNGAHPNGVVAGDTLFAASKVTANEPHDARTHRITFRLVGTKNVRPKTLLVDGADLFSPELTKKDGRVKEKVFEIERTVLVRKKP
jgi:2-methylfumaryl-CoA hydratase